VSRRALESGENDDDEGVDGDGEGIRMKSCTVRVRGSYNRTAESTLEAAVGWPIDAVADAGESRRWKVVGGGRGRERFCGCCGVVSQIRRMRLRLRLPQD
jgi:hypothetical protein